MCKNILTLHRYRDFCVESFYRDSPVLWLNGTSYIAG